MELKKLRITDKKVEVLHTMGLERVQDLLTYYPFRYEVIEEKPKEEWQKNERITLEGIIITPARVIRLKQKMSMTTFSILYDEEEFKITLFNRPWTKMFPVGKKITIFGKYEGGQRITALQYNFQALHEQLGILPVYPIKDGISQKDIYKYIKKAWDTEKGDIEEFIPEGLRQKYRLIPKKQAIHDIHFPNSMKDVTQSLRHLKYEEFLRFQLSMQAIKQQEQMVALGHAKLFEVEDVWELQKTLSFTLTDDQKMVIEDILHDLSQEKVMYRMVQGDVGCGKTLVAAFGMYACVLSHHQAAFLAPTEILAKQHAQNLKQLLKDFGIVVEVLYASLKPKEKKEILKKLNDNEIDIIVGTHALFQEDVSFHSLGMVVADEQHRFGVFQRRKMLAKGDKVDFLFMSATPIPRTLAISLYGDMEVSTIKSLPQGRKPITTKLIQSRSMAPILEEVLERIEEGNQCYVVCPAIEKNEDYDLRNTQEIYQGMQQTLGKKYRIGLLHGKMSAQEKDETMQLFVQQELDILVSTTVIEVGVDVKTANIMIIYDAHRFGLSQIHQLRGRVGRGEMAGYCYLLSDTKDEDSLKRLKVCEKTNDGFEIAKYDLQLRGPGDMLGTRQSGVPSFILGDVVQDVNILEVAREDAQHILQNIEDVQYESIRIFLKDTMKHSSYLD